MTETPRNALARIYLRRRQLLWLMVVLAITSSAPAANQAPIFNTLIAADIESTDSVSVLTFSLSHSSIFQLNYNGNWLHWFDMEISEAMLRWRHALGDGIQLGINVPLIMFSPGFMDGFIDWYHDLFGFPDYGRGLFPRDTFIFRLEKEGENIVQSQPNRPGLGDIRLQLKKTFPGRKTIFGLAAYVELPTGRAHLGFGNGSLDTGLALLLKNHLSENLNLLHNIAVLFPGDFRGEKTIETRTFFFAGSEMRMRMFSNWWMNLELTMQTSPFQNTGLPFLDNTALRFTGGIAYEKGSNRLGVRFGEDLNTVGATDFTVTFIFERVLHSPSF